jgi:hypothetical protein
MKLPLIIDDHGDIMIFRDKSIAEGHLEAVDVLNGEYVGFDAGGHPLIFVARDRDSAVRIECDCALSDEASLRAALIRFLAANRVPAELTAGRSIELLLGMALSYPVR